MERMMNLGAGFCIAFLCLNQILTSLSQAFSKEDYNFSF